MVNGVFAADQLKLFVERIERLEEEKKAIGDDIKDVKAEAKASGFDVPTMMKCIKLRKLDRGVRDEQESLLETYKSALGLSFDSTPLGSSTADNECPGHQASDDDPKVCRHCGTHVDAERPDDESLVDQVGEALEDAGLTVVGGKAKRSRAKKVRDPSDGSETLVTVPANSDLAEADAG